MAVPKPRPLTFLTRKVDPSTGPHDEPQRLDPQPDHIAGPVFPGGRGYEQHGVPMEGDPSGLDESHWYEQPDGRYPLTAPEHEPDPTPIPVFVVGSAGVRNLKRMRIAQYRASAMPAQVAGTDDHGSRTQTRITNLSATAGDRLWVASEQQRAGVAWGYPLDPGKEIVLASEGQVWVCADAAAPTVVGGNTIGVAVLTEYEVKAQ